METEKPSCVIFASEARKQLFKGMEIAANAVGITLGPRGKIVIIQKQNEAPVVTKDGVTVSKSIKLRDPVERMGAEMIKEAASRTNDTAGDGTTTATVLTHALVKEGMKLLEAGYSSQVLCQAIDHTVKCAIEVLKASAHQLTTHEELAQVGTISANGDKNIGDLIAEAMERVGKDGVITVEDAKSMTTTLEIVNGMQLDRGYLSPYFVTNNDKMHALYANARVLVTDKKLTNIRELIPILEKVSQAQESLLIIADDIEGEALQGLVINRLKSNLAVVAIKAPGYGTHRTELLQDICVLTGASLVSSTTGLSLDKLTPNELGRCKKIVVDAKKTTLVGSERTKDGVLKHVSDLKEQLSDMSLTEEDITKLKVRIAKLASGVAVIKVGGATELEMIERKYRIEDALHAVRAASDEGIIAGGGLALLKTAQIVRTKMKSDSPEFAAGIDMVLKACEAPLRTIVKNSGQSPDVILNEVKKSLCGYNAATGQYVDLIAAGVIDPVKVTRTALQNAASVAMVFLSLDAVVCDDLK